MLLLNRVLHEGGLPAYCMKDLDFMVKLAKQVERSPADA